MTQLVDFCIQFRNGGLRIVRRQRRGRISRRDSAACGKNIQADGVDQRVIAGFVNPDKTRRAQSRYRIERDRQAGIGIGRGLAITGQQRHGCGD